MEFQIDSSSKKWYKSLAKVKFEVQFVRMETLFETMKFRKNDECEEGLSLILNYE